MIENQLSSDISVKQSPASIPRRALALLIDFGILYAITYTMFLIGLFCFVILMAVFVQLFGKTSGEAVGTIALVIFVLFTISFTDLYFAYSEYKWGRTIGKKIVGLRVISMREPKLRFMTCLVRSVCRWVEVGLVFPALIAMICNSKRQRIADLTLGTMVVYSKREETKQNFIYLESTRYWSLHGKHTPTIIPRELARKYLAIVFKMHTDHDSANQSWENLLSHIETLKPYIQNSDSLTQNDLVTYLAEVCNQQVNYN